MVVFLGDQNEGLQSNLMLFVSVVFFGIQISNQPYYTKGLNQLSMTSLLVAMLFVFLRVFIKVAFLNAGPDDEDTSYLGAVTGNSIDE